MVLSLERDAQSSQASRWAGASAGVGELVEGAELFFERVGRVQRPVGGLDLREREALAGVEFLGRFE
jgi:hypothetical protein